MNPIDLQVSFFKKIKEKLPNNISLPEVVANYLNISNDSAYRRIRGEKSLTLDEIEVLVSKTNISLDQFFNRRGATNEMQFSGNLIDHEIFDFENYLSGIASQLKQFAEASEKEMLIFNKDIPMFLHFMFPELAAFKCYFWSRYNLNNSKFNKGQFLIEDYIKVFNTLGKTISDLYTQIPSTEIWNIDCINSTIRQIDYYSQSKIFRSTQDIITVYNCLEKQIDHIEQQVECGCKFDYGKSHKTNVKYTFFINDYILGDNTFLVKLDGQKMVFLVNNVINYLLTTSPVFVDYSFQTMDILLKKSTLISEIGERDREAFFNELREKIYARKRKVG
ncbi:hypothetical protein EXU57_20255 [Segetibacter sp. 3557_3]|uniref:hypothetical protein n=1 Tax=Segetibacter sp. 3557_3 TaxID=2547429 RepID=UPI0010591D8A|nr:hypothetical protein [Segetibacter sp. 3557_3]TDH21276.1 hypothetical protein EXU57_20255 [Segetibacter sp. 3557_3]